MSCLVTKSSEEEYNFSAMHLMWGPIFADKGSTRFCRTVSVLFLKGSSGSPPPRRTRTGHQMCGPYGKSTLEPWDSKNGANKSSSRSNWDDWQMFGAADWLSWEKKYINHYLKPEIWLGQLFSTNLSFLKKKILHFWNFYCKKKCTHM